MEIQIYVLELRGQKSGTFAVLPMENIASADEYGRMWKRNLDNILNEFKRDREGDNPSISIDEFETNWWLFNEKQELYRILPFDVSKVDRVLDAYCCRGTRFGLPYDTVFVEVHQNIKSSMHRIWAEIYDIGDCQIPSAVIEVKSYRLPIDRHMKEVLLSLMEAEN
ncbi:MAG TPA: hypothetical protein P5080_02200 [Candidatus Paceibacterota bacterium]|nr:hypothetical protein [Candidatus Pacearchaeota archaeon]HRZ50601.1 hypothetical protein [Candidatus Paceibacterota bacterium]HSA36502.1 hypothetical protein [Candidatus Paceibacterota bacterium]